MMGLRVVAVTLAALAALAKVARGPLDWLVRIVPERDGGSLYL